MRRYYDCIETITPRQEPYGGCPIGEENCLDCPHFKRSGTLGGEIWIDCDYDGEKWEWE
jgi:hypothetical protein